MIITSTNKVVFATEAVISWPGRIIAYPIAITQTGFTK